MRFSGSARARDAVSCGASVFLILLVTAFLCSFAAASDDLVTVDGGTLPKSSQLAGTKIAPFRIGKHEVTFGEWNKVCDWAGKNGYDSLQGMLPSGGFYPKGKEPWAGAKADKFPVAGTTWYDAVKWCNAKSESEGFEPVYTMNGEVYRRGQVDPKINRSANGYRLPTKAEWEWAAMGAARSRGYKFSGGNDIKAVAHYDGGYPQAVGQLKPNELGVYDMSGNVDEWCDGVEKISDRRVRGGNCYNQSDDPAANTEDYEVNHRGEAGGPDFSHPWTGFRVARTANNPAAGRQE